jgi:hypothetical protein
MVMFATKPELIAWLERNGFEQMSNGNWYLPGRYDLSHGEYERPDYAPRRYKGGWSLHATYYYFAGTLRAKEDGRVCDDFFLEMT